MTVQINKLQKELDSLTAIRYNPNEEVLSTIKQNRLREQIEQKRNEELIKKVEKNNLSYKDLAKERVDVFFERQDLEKAGEKEKANKLFVKENDLAFQMSYLFDKLSKEIGEAFKEKTTERYFSLLAERKELINFHKNLEAEKEEEREASRAAEKNENERLVFIARRRHKTLEGFPSDFKNIINKLFDEYKNNEITDEDLNERVELLKSLM